MIDRLYRWEQPPLVLCVASSDQHPALFPHEHHLRREYMSHLFAQLGLLPDPVFVDFTQQLLARDFVVQNFIAGNLWYDMTRALTPMEAAAL